MNPIYEKLFGAYGEPTLRNAENFDNYALEKMLDRFPLTDAHRRELIDVLYDYYYQWSLDAFTTGLHLGLSLLDERPRRPEPQKR